MVDFPASDVFIFMLVFGGIRYWDLLLMEKNVHQLRLVVTLPETNIAPENGWLEY